MDKGSLIRLREQLDRAIESDTPEAYAALSTFLETVLKKSENTEAKPAGLCGEAWDEASSALKAVEEVWYRGTLPDDSSIPVAPDHKARLAGLLSDMLAVQRFALAISNGDLSQSLKARGVMAGSFKAVQSNLRHLTWQTSMVARGDFSQRVDFMGEFSESFNSMVSSLNGAHERINRFTEELLEANTALSAEIIERKQAEEALRVNREWLRVTLESIGDAVMTADIEGRVTFLNPVAVALTGWESAEAAGQPSHKVFRIINEKTGEPAEDIVQRVLREGRAALLANHTALISCDGSQVPIEDSAAPIRSSEGDLIGVVIVFRDVTEKRRAQEDICRARDELEIRVLERTAELEKVNRDLSDFNHIAAHDLQEPLRQMITFGDRLLLNCGSTLNAENRYYVERIQSLALRSRSLTRDILKYSMISSRNGDFSDTDLKELLNDVIDSFKEEIERKDATLEMGELGTLEIDSAQISDVFKNLLSNALKFTGEEKPKIRIHGKPVGDEDYLIFIEDNGIGFDESFKNRIFIPFQRLHGKSRYEGNGIGLAICRKILEAHGGGIKAQSCPDAGSTFIISLPVCRRR